MDEAVQNRHESPLDENRCLTPVLVKWRTAMAVPLAHRLGALRERDFRLLFLGTTITSVGDRLAGIALAFTVLDIASATALGIVFAVRQGMEALVVVAGGVLPDRVPRNLVLVGASLVQGALGGDPPAAVRLGRSTGHRQGSSAP